jgi:hypothetical protein
VSPVLNPETNTHWCLLATFKGVYQCRCSEFQSEVSCTGDFMVCGYCLES